MRAGSFGIIEGSRGNRGDRPGLLATVQDLGRPGLGHLGVPHSGAADAASLRRANRLVGNPPDAAGLELRWAGPCSVSAGRQ